MAEVLTFPTFPLTRQGRPIPIYDTSVQTSPSGVEARISRNTGRFRFKLSLQLRAWLSEDAILFGFFQQVGARRDSFLFIDKDGMAHWVRFDEDDLDHIEYKGGGLYSGELEFLSVGSSALDSDIDRHIYLVSDDGDFLADESDRLLVQA